MARTRVLGVVTALCAVVGLPAYAAAQTPGQPGAVPAATPTRIAPSATNPPAPTQGATPSPSAPGTSAPPATSAAPSSATPYAPPSRAGAVPAPAATTIRPSQRFSVAAAATNGAPTDSTWPDAAEIFTRAELAQVIPGLTSVTPSDCSTSQIAGRATTRNTRCTLTLKINGEPADTPSRIMVTIRGFGSPDAIGGAWSSTWSEQDERSRERPGLYTFYRNGSLGTSAAFTDGTTTRVLLQRAGIAGEVWFSGVGFTTLKSDYLQSRADFRQRVSPALMQLLAAKMAPA